MQTSQQHPALSLVIPTYNERENLPKLVSRLITTLERAGHAFEIIVVDDDSPDQTWKIASEMAAKDDRVKIIRRHICWLWPRRRGSP